MQNCAVTFEEYVAKTGEERRETLLTLRKLVRETVPAAVESTQHSMPYYEHHGDLCAFAAQRNHFSFYVMGGGDALEKRRDELGKLKCGKSCIRFRKLEDLPLPLIREIVADVARQNEARAAAS